MPKKGGKVVTKKDFYHVMPKGENRIKRFKQREKEEKKRF